MRVIIGRYGHHAHHDDVREMLGLGPKAKLPKEGMPPRLIQDIVVWVTPLGPNPTRHKRSTHRVLAKCPDCSKVLSVGRLHQHVCPPSAGGYTEKEITDALRSLAIDSADSDDVSRPRPYSVEGRALLRRLEENTLTQEDRDYAVRMLDLNKQATEEEKELQSWWEGLTDEERDQIQGGFASDGWYTLSESGKATARSAYARRTR